MTLAATLLGGMSGGGWGTGRRKVKVNVLGGMAMRKIDALSGLVVGVALAVAPVAVADGDSAGADFSWVLEGQIQSMNFLFESQATLAGVADKVIDVSDANPFLTIAQEDVNAELGAMLYGINWEDEISAEPGAYSLFNGALTQFIDSNNVLLFAILNGGDQIDFEDAADYLFGSDAAIAAGLAGDSAWEDAALFFQAGLADIGGYFAIDV
jgi:hypothetical protein